MDANGRESQIRELLLIRVHLRSLAVEGFTIPEN
jgi:hypothetical protein